MKNQYQFLRMLRLLGLLCAPLLRALPAFGLNATNADTLFSAYNTSFYTSSGGSGHYKDTLAGGETYFWGQAEEIEGAIDHYDRTGSAATKTMLSELCTGFINRNGTSWTGNEYNDDIAWAVIAFCRTYQITGNTTFRDRAKANFDAMYARAWDTSFTGGGLWWRQSDKQSKNACINGPAAVGACYLYDITGDPAYLAKAMDCYAWERRVLYNSNTGGVYDNIGTNGSISYWTGTYNQGTFVGAATFLFRYTGLPHYYQDALLATTYTRNSICTAGILPVYGWTGDVKGFHSILARWVGKMVREQNLMNAFGGWLNQNADAAWNVRNANNLSWYNWTAPTPGVTSNLTSWECLNGFVMAQIGCTNDPAALRITPEGGFTAVAPSGFLPAAYSTDLLLTNAGANPLNWSLATTSAWLRASANTGTLPAGVRATNLVTISFNPAAVANMAAGRYFSTVWVTNLANAAVQGRVFALVVSSANTPIAVTGYNARILAANTATVSSPGVAPFDYLTASCFYQAGLGGTNRGLPPKGVFTSLVDSNTIFQLGPYGATNALLMGYTYPKFGTLTLQAPQAYHSLAVLATSANAPSNASLGTLVLNFVNGTRSQVLNFSAPDWFTNAANAAIQGVGRFRFSGAVGENNGALAPRLYQTTLDLAALGLTEPIASITFSNPANATGLQIGAILGVSGKPALDDPFGQAMLTNRALGYWRLDETSGLVARDLAGDNSGVYSSKVLLGQPGYNLVGTHPCPRFGLLATSNSCVTNININFAAASNAAFSVEAWVNGPAQTTDAGIVTKGYGSGGEQFNLDCGGGNRGFRFFVREAGGAARLASSSVVPDGRWHNVVGVCDQPNGQVLLYVDGVIVAQGTIGTASGILSSSTPMSIGSRQSGSGKPYDFQFVGSIEEVAVYGYALSSSQVSAHFSLATNRAPVFSSHPLVLAPVQAGQNYSGTLAASASDSNGDTITFSKLGGPDWLTLAGNGALGGKPFSVDVGANSFLVRAADPSGLADTNTLVLEVVAAPAPVATLSAQSTNLLLSWTGGIPPFDVLMATNPGNSIWQPILTSLLVSNATILPTNPGAFYRIQGK